MLRGFVPEQEKMVSTNTSQMIEKGGDIRIGLTPTVQFIFVSFTCKRIWPENDSNLRATGKRDFL